MAKQKFCERAPAAAMPCLSRDANCVAVAREFLNATRVLIMLGLEEKPLLLMSLNSESATTASTPYIGKPDHPTDVGKEIIETSTPPAEQDISFTKEDAAKIPQAKKSARKYFGGKCGVLLVISVVWSLYLEGYSQDLSSICHVA
ncbi:hypothetical protein Tco_1035523 [Tanacetum coccineum]